MSASSVIELVRKLVTDSTATSDKDRAEVLAMLTEARAALVQRNNILLASVGELMFEDKTVFYRQRKKGPVPVGQNSVWESTLHGLEELDEIGARLFKVSEDLWQYVYMP